MTSSKMILISLVTFSIAVFPASPSFSGRNNLEKNNMPVEKQYPAVILQKGKVVTDRDFEEDRGTAGTREEPDTDRTGGITGTSDHREGLRLAGKHVKRISGAVHILS